MHVWCVVWRGRTLSLTYAGIGTATIRQRLSRKARKFLKSCLARFTHGTAGFLLKGSLIHCALHCMRCTRIQSAMKHERHAPHPSTFQTYCTTIFLGCGVTPRTFVHATHGVLSIEVLNLPAGHAIQLPLAIIPQLRRSKPALHPLHFVQAPLTVATSCQFEVVVSDDQANITLYMSSPLTCLLACITHISLYLHWPVRGCSWKKRKTR